MPLPITVPSAATSTASPASKSPSAATTPTGSRLEPRSRRTRAAPSSTTSPPSRRLRVFEPELEAGRLARWAAKRVPDRLPGGGRASVPALVPLQITAGIPDSLAISAAATLLRMPPEPKAEVRSPISRAASCAKSVTSAIGSAAGSSPGSAE